MDATRRTVLASIEMITENLKENEIQFRSGKRTKKLYLTCRLDGKKRLRELRKK